MCVCVFIFLCLRVLWCVVLGLELHSELGKLKATQCRAAIKCHRNGIVSFFSVKREKCFTHECGFLHWETETLDWIGTNSGICHDKNFHARYPASFCLHVTRFLAHLHRNCNFLKTNTKMCVCEPKLPFKSCMATAQKFRKNRYKHREWVRAGKGEGERERGKWECCR